MNSLYRIEARKLLTLGLPLIGSNLALFAIGLTDAMMLGWYDVNALAAVTLAGGFYFILFVMGGGFAWAVMPLVAEAIESGDKVQARRVTRMGLWASVVYGAIFMAPLIWSEPIFLALGQDPDIAALGQMYLRIAGWQLILALVVQVIRSFLSALERTQIILWMTLATAGLNVLVNYVLIFGNWGAPELGIRGAAIASVSLVLASILVLAVYLRRVVPEYALFTRVWRVDAGALMQVVRMGIPIGLTSVAEAGLFVIASIMLGWFGPVHLAAHGAALQLASAVFVIHLGLSQAATVRAGQAYGRRDEAALRVSAWTSLAMSALVAIGGITLFVTMPELLVSAFVNPAEPARDEVVELGMGLLMIAAIFQSVDAGQAMMLGLLRGVQDAKIPMWMAAFSYWGVGVGTSYVLGLPLGLEGHGVWWGLVVGLSFACFLLGWRFWTHSVRIGPQTN